MKKPYTNNTDKIQHIGNVTLMPGETREVEEMHLRAHVGVSDEEKSKAPEVSVVEQIRADSIKKIAKQLPDFTIETINDLEAAEKADEKPRTGLLTAITEERLIRSAAADKEAEEILALFVKGLDGLSDEELTEQVEQMTGKPESEAYLEAVNSEIAKRDSENEGSEMEQFIASLADMSDAELSENVELYTDEPESVAYLEAVNTEIENRAAE